MTDCDACGKVYNQFLGDRFWAGRYDVPGYDETLETLCDKCHRKLIRNN
ncbi:hypothetical protein [Natronosalvus rutilus]|uniref:Uncharacterized protein n=1 Tax=Natronosalvus rutilus TaxID=2953753 RepID=A0A9E7SVK5_9EURY|nr:hypothetical protein [Natronosalvus rutilus]UTF55959.1 hypothetical protein NGM29_20930 [Natronosalvus rutilus]